MFGAPTSPVRWPRMILAAFVVLTCGAAFAVNSPVPFIDLPVVPAVAAPGGTGFTLTVNGAGFVSGSVVNWNGSPRTTTFVSAAQVTAAILASDIVTASTARITVSNPAPGGGTSSVVYFEITNPASTITVAGLQLSQFANDSLSAADVNNDGKLDLLVGSTNSNGTSQLSVALGNGDGTFQPAKIVIADIADGFVLGDFNGDRKLDLAFITPNSSPSSVSVLLGNGDGTFQPPIVSGSQGNTFYSGLVIGDFNQDGNLDLVTDYQTGSDQGFSVLLGNGDGTFQVGTNDSTPFEIGLVGDFNGDGVLDLVGFELNTPDPFFTEAGVLFGNGDGTFQSVVPSVSFFDLQSVSAADVNGDGKLDLIDWTFEDDPSFFIVGAGVSLGDGSGIFSGGGSVSGFPAFPPDDFNGDGKLDFVLSPSVKFPPVDDLSIAPGNGDGTFGTGTAITTTTGLALYPKLQGDFNGDGKMDLIAYGQTGAWLFLQGSFLIGTPSPAGLTFGQAIDTISLGQVVTLTNTGNLPLTLSALNITGTNESEFQQTNKCPTSLAVAAKCQITVTFSPAAVGTRSATLNIPNNGIGNKAVPLSGVGTDFSISEPMPNSVTVTAGQTAQYIFEVDPIDGFKGGVNLTCSGTPAGAKCLPALATLNGSSGIKVTFRVETTARTTAMNRGMFSKNERWLACGLFGLPLIISLAGVGIRRPRTHGDRWMFLWLMVTAMLLLPACGGGNGGGGGSGSGTPAGTYQLTVAGKYTAGGTSLTHTATIVLTVE